VIRGDRLPQTSRINAHFRCERLESARTLVAERESVSRRELVEDLSLRPKLAARFLPIVGVVDGPPFTAKLAHKHVAVGCSVQIFIRDTSAVNSNGDPFDECARR